MKCLTCLPERSKGVFLSGETMHKSLRVRMRSWLHGKVQKDFAIFQYFKYPEAIIQKLNNLKLCNLKCSKIQSFRSADTMPRVETFVLRVVDHSQDAAL